MQPLHLFTEQKGNLLYHIQTTAFFELLAADINDDIMSEGGGCVKV